MSATPFRALLACRRVRESEFVSRSDRIVDFDFASKCKERRKDRMKDLIRKRNGRSTRASEESAGEGLYSSTERVTMLESLKGTGELRRERGGCVGLKRRLG